MNPAQIWPWDMGTHFVDIRERAYQKDYFFGI